MITVTRTCDRCSKNVLGDEQFWNVEIRYSGAANNNPPYAYMTGPKVQWCRECLETCGLVPRAIVRPETPTPTIEDIIRDIVREEAAE